MPEFTGTPQTTPTPPQPQATFTYFWIATIEKPNGDKLCCHANAEITPGVHTRADVFRDVITFLEDRHGDIVCLSFSLEPNALSAPAVTA